MALEKVDWNGLIERSINTAIDIIQAKVMGVKTPVGAGVTVSPSGVSMFSSSVLLPFALVATAIVGIFLLARK